MVTYVVGTDGSSATEALGDFLATHLAEDDHVEALTVLSARGGAQDRVRADALDALEERIAGTASVTATRLDPEKHPARALVDRAEQVDADRIVVGLRHHSGAERLVFGSVAYALLKIARRPVTLVPLLETETADDLERRDLKYMY
jgi:nucleotide-binding universal stress UspA family protein